MFDETRLEQAGFFLDQCIERQALPGAALSVITRNRTIYEYTGGWAHIEKKIPIKSDTVFDLASLTKVCSTLPMVLLLLEDGLLELDDSINRYLNNSSLKDFTIRHLLTHTTGLPPSLDFYSKGYTFQEAVDLLKVFPQSSEPGQEVVYSDLNFMLLAYIVEKVSGQPLDILTRSRIYRPLGMNETGFNPKFNLERIAATEYRESLEGYQWGTVHDENANSFGGVSGHAGLFSTTKDLKKYARWILNRGKWEDQQLLSPVTLEASVKNYTKALGKNRGLGWQLIDANYSSAGSFFPDDGFGHTGFTGTSLWFAGNLDFAVVLLTNRVHFGRDINIIRVRKVVHNLISIAYNPEG